MRTVCTSAFVRLPLLAGGLAIVSAMAGLRATAQVAPGPGVNPRAVWSDPPETFETPTHESR